MLGHLNFLCSNPLLTTFKFSYKHLNHTFEIEQSDTSAAISKNVFQVFFIGFFHFSWLNIVAVWYKHKIGPCNE